MVDSLSVFEKENANLRVNEAVANELSKYRVKADLRGDALVALGSHVNVTDTGMVFGDGMTVEDGVKNYFETRTSYLDPVGSAGSGADGKGGGEPINKMNMTGSKKDRLSSIQQMLKEG